MTEPNGQEYTMEATQQGADNWNALLTAMRTKDVNLYRECEQSSKPLELWRAKYPEDFEWVTPLIPLRNYGQHMITPSKSE